LVASLVFHYQFAGPAGMLPIVLLGVLTYGAGLYAGGRPGTRVFPLFFCMLAGALVFYKYSTLLAGSFVDLFSNWIAPERAEALLGWRGPAAPLAISFFTFEFIHYLYEVRVRGASPIRRPVDFALFAVFFPTLASGPIKRFGSFVPQLARPENPAPLDAWEGARRVMLGVFKKVCIADLVIEPIAVLEDSTEWTAPVVAALAILQGVRIYYDFAGYTDIAIGLARMLGLVVPENFDRPYRTTSLQDFWRRWHMSLSTWIRDYLYVPMGGNRGRRALHLLLAMGICGIWHGAAWNFALWGLYHGAGLAVEAQVRQRVPQLFGDSRSLLLLRWAVCYGFVTYGWLLFFYPLDTVIHMTWEALQ
jgi:alginate O-acetyltransferase complex protein AlgI